MDPEAQDAIRAGDILRERWEDPARASRVNLYLGSGRYGACFDAWGLVHPAGLMHADHRRRDEAGVVRWLPVARVTWAERPPAVPTRCRQHLDLLDGRLTTQLDGITLVAQFHPDRRDVLGIELSYDGTAMPPLLLAPDVPAGPGGPTADGMHWATTLKAGDDAQTLLAVNVHRHEGQSHIRPTEQGARIEFEGTRGRHLIVVGAGATARGGTVADDLTTWTERHPFGESATAAWRRRWANTDLRHVDPHRRAMCARSLYYWICSVAPEHHAPGPPHGWTGNGPLSTSHGESVDAVAGLLTFGQLDLARSIIESSRGVTTQSLEAAGRIAVAANQAGERLNDSAWTRQTAWPIVHEAARLFATRLKEGAGGVWTIDDANLAPLARQCLQLAVVTAGQLGESGREFANYRGILSDGIAGADRAVALDEHFAAETDAEQIQFFAPGGKTPYHLPTHAKFLRA